MSFDLTLYNRRFLFSNNCSIKIELYDIYFDKTVINICKKNKGKNYLVKSVIPIKEGIFLFGKDIFPCKKELERIIYVFEKENGYFRNKEMRYDKHISVDFKFEPWKYTKILNFQLVDRYIYGIRIYEGFVDILNNNGKFICLLYFINEDVNKENISVDFVINYLDLE